VYRGEVHGQLPFETRGMDDPVPTIDFSPSGGLDLAYLLEREDVDSRQPLQRSVSYLATNLELLQTSSVSWMV
jgi:autophagy-related protein 11